MPLNSPSKMNRAPRLRGKYCGPFVTELPATNNGKEAKPPICKAMAAMPECTGAIPPHANTHGFT
ncbi:hypothetical protein COO20_06270 [Thalassospira marina]|uniref:Uncharacterized protein n=1 Tax=Thalassospira marina TaxID=2048283 RepID=A0A2N3KWX2_9PROT|nr:hypothetical protein COO20_06270 [Thalassospira marina]